MKMNLMSSIWLRAKRSTAAFVADCRAVAAVELAVIAPVMLLMFFATVEFSNGVAIDRKVTLVAHTLSDLTSRSTTVTDTELTNFFTAGTGIMYPYPASPIKLHDFGALCRTRHPCREGAVEHGSGAACGEVHDDHT